MKIVIPKKEELVSTGDSDPIEYGLYHLPIIKYPFILRLKKVIQLFGNKKYDKMLEVGTGSGILIPELSRHCNSLYCIDIHDRIEDIKNFVKKKGINAKVSYGDIFNLKFKPRFFDAIVCISIIEHLVEVGKALDSIKRVLKDDGILFVGIPTKNIIGETIIELIAPGSKDRHVSDSVKIIREVRKRFKIVRFNNLSTIFGSRNSVYTTFKCVKL